MCFSVGFFSYCLQLTFFTVYCKDGYRGGGGSDAFFQVFDPLPTQNVPPLYCFEISIFGDGPIKTNFEVERAQKNATFW